MSDFPTEASQNATPEALDRLLEHPAIWRGRSAAHIETVSSGFPSLDEALPGGGWPRAGLVEVLLPHAGIGELALFMPALAALSREPVARWCAWISPPFEPFAPALAAHGVALERVLVARAGKPLWALEQALGSGACAAALAWIERAHPRDVRRLQLATERGRTLGVLFREPHGGRGSTCAALRLRLAAAKDGVRITLVKSRGGLRGTVDLLWQQP
ncbi:MAG TPA: translesion DNA synthesis-associated protein ImuA [Steroidobacteraceae bacterium]|nr:translesion DNA synthesis-associated protein ImuA [Steroidobacteraceae bacterium]